MTLKERCLRVGFTWQAEVLLSVRFLHVRSKTKLKSEYFRAYGADLELELSDDHWHGSVDDVYNLTVIVAIQMLKKFVA